LNRDCTVCESYATEYNGWVIDTDIKDFIRESGMLAPGRSHCGLDLRLGPETSGDFGMALGTKQSNSRGIMSLGFRKLGFNVFIFENTRSANDAAKSTFLPHYTLYWLWYIS